MVEEAGEILQMLGKLMGSRGDDIHWNVRSLKANIEDEIADLMAACKFVIEMCHLRVEHIETRMQRKLELFRQWHKEDKEP